MAARTILSVVTSWGFLQSTLSNHLNQDFGNKFKGIPKDLAKVTHTPKQLCKSSSKIPLRNTGWPGSTCSSWFFPLRSATHIADFQNGSSGLVIWENTCFWKEERGLQLCLQNHEQKCNFNRLFRPAFMWHDQLNRHQCRVSTPKRPLNLVRIAT